MLIVMVFLMASHSIESGRLQQDGLEVCGVCSVTRGLKGQDEGGGRKNNDCLSSGSAHILQFVKTIQFASG